MAVIDIGSTAIRMTIADIDEHGQPASRGVPSAIRQSRQRLLHKGKN